MSKRKLDEIRVDINESLKNYNELISQNKFEEAIEAEETLKEFEAEYGGVKRKEVFETLAANENPVYAAAKTLCYEVISHKIEREDGKPVMATLIPDKKVKIDLVRFSSFIKHNLVWYYRLERLNEMLAEKVAKDLGTSIKDFDLSNGAKSEEKQKYSNRQVVKLLQSVVDEILFIPDEKGNNTVKMTNYDMNFLINCQTTKDKKDFLKVRIAKSREIQGIFLEMLHRAVTDKKYSVAVPTAKSDDTAVVAKETAKPEKPEENETADVAEEIVK